MRAFSISVCLLTIFGGVACAGDSRVPIDGGGAGGTAADGGGGAGGEGGALPAGVDIVRDAQGVPHIFGATEESAFYGLGYAVAQDRLFQMDIHRRYMRGRMAETFGAADALVAHDTKMRVLGYGHHADGVVAHEDFPAETLSLLQAYADGVNAYVESASLPEAFALVDVTTFEPWTPADSLVVWDRVADRFNKLDFDNEIKLQNDCRAGNCTTPLCPGPVPIDEAAAVVPPSDAWPPSEMACYSVPDRNTDPIAFKASHGWVVHGSRTESGEPVLALDPKLEVTAPSFWHSFHIATPSYSARGVGMAGAPAFIIFWNERVGQTLTAMGGFDVSDTYQLDVAADDSSYMLDGQSVAFETRAETIAVKGASPIDITVRSTVHGAVITPLSSQAPPGNEYALKHVELSNDDTHSIVGAMEMMGAHDMTSYRAALEKWLLPGANSLFAAKDDEVSGGHIGYHMAAAIPRRVANVIDGVDYRGRHPYDGSTTANDWTGFLDANERPHVIDPPEGFTFSANHLPVGKWYDDYAYTGVVGGGDSFRSHQLRNELGSMLADGATVSTADLHALHFDGGSDAGEIYRDMLAYLETAGRVVIPAAAVAPTNPAEKAGKVLVALNAWIDNGGEMRHSNPQTPIVSKLISQLPFSIRPVLNPAVGCQFGGGEGGANFLLKSFVADPDAVMGDLAVATFIVTEAAAAWDDVAAGRDVDPTAWSAAAQPPDFTVLYQFNQFCAPSLTGKCSMDASHDLAVPLDGAFVPTILSSQGSSGTGTVDFAAVDDAAMLVPMGASEDPTSAFFDSGMAAWIAGDGGDPTTTPRAPLSREAVDATASSTETLVP